MGPILRAYACCLLATSVLCAAVRAMDAETPRSGYTTSPCDMSSEQECEDGEDRPIERNRTDITLWLARHGYRATPTDRVSECLDNHLIEEEEVGDVLEWVSYNEGDISFRTDGELRCYLFSLPKPIMDIYEEALLVPRVVVGRPGTFTTQVRELRNRLPSAGWHPDKTKCQAGAVDKCSLSASELAEPPKAGEPCELWLAKEEYAMAMAEGDDTLPDCPRNKAVNRRELYEPTDYTRALFFYINGESYTDQTHLHYHDHVDIAHWWDYEDGWANTNSGHGCRPYYREANLNSTKSQLIYSKPSMGTQKVKLVSSSVGYLSWNAWTSSCYPVNTNNEAFISCTQDECAVELTKGSVNVWCDFVQASGFASGKEEHYEAIGHTSCDT